MSTLFLTINYSFSFRIPSLYRRGFPEDMACRFGEFVRLPLAPSRSTTGMTTSTSNMIAVSALPSRNGERLGRDTLRV